MLGPKPPEPEDENPQRRRQLKPYKDKVNRIEVQG
jgi:hypothetical protein